MAKLTKADAARQLGISRTTLYKLINQGKVSAAPDGTIDTAELVRAVSTMHIHERPPAHIDVDAKIDGYEHYERPEYAHREQEWTSTAERQLTSRGEHPRTHLDMLVDMLREQLQAVQERERAYREHIERLTMMLHEAQHRYDRLLEAPRSAPAPAPPGPVTTSDPSAPRGEMRQRIVALLHDHPEGLTPGEIRSQLQVEKRLSNTCIAMLRDGLLRRIGPGRYVAKEE